MDFDDFSDVHLDRDPDDLLPEDWDDDGGEIELAGIRRRVMAENAEHA